ncbi:kinase domain protein [Rhizoctonia solani AG-3 Rhs1AP]|nr:kinase domain protein [Rhizoctonia solani AG-3 Rhs1AP]KEP47382.1 kinase domain protein [Rhizoctonia solani 123E]
MPFVPVIVSCEVLEENTKYIKRRVALKNGAEMTEDIDLYAPSLATFKSNTGSFVTNLISENAEGERFLTFTFSMPLQGVEVGSEAEVAKGKEMQEACKGAVAQSLKVTLEMFEQGKLN